ncbi:MAG TPA: DUF4416 family protein [bacterium]|nr:DUF4416 family protein [bacterium]HQI49533.1 DUF4416 family protein [bacterium]HQJ64711.1 DUF4416 family protein [bacterium]
MGIARPAAPVRLICALCYREESDRDSACDQLERAWGPISARTEPFPFIHTTYYEAEMGEGLRKFYCAFKQLIEPMEIVAIKLATNQIEAGLATAGRRRVNIDPGYIEAAKLVLATTKNFSHRIYLGQGIYGDVQLFWQGGRFKSNPWTYADYLDPAILEFFTSIRQDFMKEGKNQ